MILCFNSLKYLKMQLFFYDLHHKKYQQFRFKSKFDEEKRIRSCKNYNLIVLLSVRKSHRNVLQKINELKLKRSQHYRLEITKKHNANKFCQLTFYLIFKIRTM